MIIPPLSVCDDLKVLVEDTRGNNTIVSTDAINERIDPARYFTVASWLTNYPKSRRQALHLALKAAGFEPFTLKRNGSVSPWKVTV